MKTMKRLTALGLIAFVLIVASVIWLVCIRVTAVLGAQRVAVASRETLNVIYRVQAICADADVAQVRWLVTKADYDRALFDRAVQAAQRDITVLEFRVSSEEQKEQCKRLRRLFDNRMKDEREIGVRCANFLASRFQQYTLVVSIIDREQANSERDDQLRDQLLQQLVVLVSIVTLASLCFLGILIGHSVAEANRHAGLAAFGAGLVKSQQETT